MIVDQQSHKLITNWESFNVGAQKASRSASPTRTRSR